MTTLQTTPEPQVCAPEPLATRQQSLPTTNGIEAVQVGQHITYRHIEWSELVQIPAIVHDVSAYMVELERGDPPMRTWKCWSEIVVTPQEDRRDAE